MMRKWLLRPLQPARMRSGALKWGTTVWEMHSQQLLRRISLHKHILFEQRFINGFWLKRFLVAPAHQL
jgi:hypothetical protein